MSGIFGWYGVCSRFITVAMVIATLSLPAAETPAPVPAPATIPLPPVETSTLPSLMPLLFGIRAEEESYFARNPGEESWAKGGVIVSYEQVRLLCDNLRFWKSLVPGMTRELPERGLLIAGPKGQDPLHVVLDSRASQLPEVSFRGLMKPGELELLRLPIDPAQPTVVRFKIILTKLGDFFGLMNSDQGWQPYAGWAERAEIVARGDIDPATGDIVRQRLDTLHLHGRKREGDQPKELARILRLKKPLEENVPAKSVPEIDCKAGAIGMTITIYFGDDGKVQGCGLGSQGSQFGTELFGSSPTREPSKPTILPASK